MLQVESFALGPLETNAYLIKSEDTHKAVLIDPGAAPRHLLDYIKDIQIEAILLTHAHFDHIGGVEEIRKLKHCPVYIHELEKDWLTDGELNGSLRWPELGGEIRAGEADELLKEGQTLHFLGHAFEVLHTPGHSPGSVSFYLKEQRMVFSGDVLFRLSVGRTDLPGGSSRELYASIHEKLFTMEEETICFPGHGPETTIGYEKHHNPYV